MADAGDLSLGRRERAAAALASRVRREARVLLPDPCSDGCGSGARLRAEIPGQHDESRLYCPTCYALRMYGLGGAARGA